MTLKRRTNLMSLQANKNNILSHSTIKHFIFFVCKLLFEGLKMPLHCPEQSNLQDISDIIFKYFQYWRLRYNYKIFSIFNYSLDWLSSKLFGS
jgi:hypothetical protein